MFSIRSYLPTPLIIYQSDVTPALIMSRVEAASGAKYSSHKEPARKFEPIAPVGSSYKPVGKVDIAALKSTPPPATKPALPSSSRPAFGAAKATPSAGHLYGRTVPGGSAPQDAWPEEKPAPVSVAATPPPPPPATSRPPTLPTAARPAFSAMVPNKTQPAFSLAPAPPPVAADTPPSRVPAAVSSSVTPTKPAEDDRIEPAKSAYTPVSLPAPKKLKNPFATKEQQTTSQASTPVPSSTTKLTWSQRQALAKKQAEEEEAKSRSAAFTPTVSTPVTKPVFKSSAPAFGRSTVSHSTPRNFGALGAAASVGAAVGVGAAAVHASQASPSSPSPPPPPPPQAAPSSYISAREAVQDAAWGTEEVTEEVEQEPEPEYEAVSNTLQEVSSST